MKTFKEFINEGVMDFLKPKSEEDILNGLDKLSDSDKIKTIIKYQMDYDLLPDNLTVKGLDCNNNQLTSLPDNLTVELTLNCNNNKLTSLPENLIVKGSLWCSNNQLTSLPDNLTVGNLNCSYNQLTELPDNLTVKGDLWCTGNSVKLKLPENAIIKGKFYN